MTRRCSSCDTVAWCWAVDSDDDWQDAYCAECLDELMAMAETRSAALRRRLDSIRHDCPAEGCLVCDA